MGYEPGTEEAAVSRVEELLNEAVARNPAPTRENATGKPVATHAVEFCACIWHDDGPRWLIYTTPDEAIAWQRVRTRVNHRDLIDPQRFAGGHVAPSEVRQWLEGTRQGWDHDVSGDPTVLPKLAQTISAARQRTPLRQFTTHQIPDTATGVARDALQRFLDRAQELSDCASVIDESDDTRRYLTLKPHNPDAVGVAISGESNGPIDWINFTDPMSPPDDWRVNIESVNWHIDAAVEGRVRAIHGPSRAVIEIHPPNGGKPRQSHYYSGLRGLIPRPGWTHRATVTNYEPYR